MDRQLHYYTGLTLVDITATGVTRNGEELARNQQRNWETVVQTMGLGAQPIEKLGLLELWRLLPRRTYNMGLGMVGRTRRSILRQYKSGGQTRTGFLASTCYLRIRGDSTLYVAYFPPTWSNT